MGIKLHSSLSSLPAACEDNVFTYWLGDKPVSCNITGAKGLVFEKQCNQFILDDGVAFLKSEDYNLVLRNDGTGTIFTAGKKWYMRNTFVHSLHGFTARKYMGGFLSFDGESIADCTVLNLIHLQDDYYMLSSEYRPITMILRKSQNEDYFNRLSICDIDMLVKVEGEHITYSSIAAGNRVELNCQLYKQKAYYLLGGVRWRA